MMAERGINIDYSTIHRWVVHFSLLQERASTPASVLLAASGIWMRLTSEFEVGGCISTVQSTALGSSAYLVQEDSRMARIRS